MLSLIVAMAEDSRVIGLEGGIPWKLSTDLQRFKAITTGHTVVMGRKTWESIPAKFRPLPNRKNIVLTRQSDYLASVPDGVGVASSLDEVLATHRALAESPVAAEWGDLFIIGGESVYREALPVADCIYLTKVRYDGDGDTFFPEESMQSFEPDPDFEFETVPVDDKNSHASVFMVLRRRPG